MFFKIPQQKTSCKLFAHDLLFLLIEKRPVEREKSRLELTYGSCDGSSYFRSLGRLTKWIDEEGFMYLIQIYWGYDFTFSLDWREESYVSWLSASIFTKKGHLYLVF